MTKHPAHPFHRHDTIRLDDRRERSAVREHLDPHCLDPAPLARLIRAAPWQRLAVIGDSIAAGDGDPTPGYRDRSWADRVAAALGASRDLAYLNLGVRGLLAADVRSTQLAAALDFAPDLAVVAAGANDMLRRSFDPAAVEASLEGIIAPIAATGALVVTFGVLDVSRTSLVPEAMRADLRSRLLRLNSLTWSVNDRHGGLHVDLFDHPACDQSLFGADMLHANRRGHAIIATSTVAALASRVRSSRAGEAVGQPA